ncbi:ATP-binding protein [Oscillibacter sp.]|uniref:sensor histidine kinase n=1 Tax=Oscillibacter sp. TaxID=1945593 RepID=UPI0028A1ADBE|nr:ATP-binding protein [Oscillibacter sp.]
MLMRKLRTQLTVLFTVLLTAALGFFALFFNGTLDKLFEGYANEQRNNQIQQIQQQINEQYDPLWGYSVSGLEVIGNAALQNGLIVHVRTLGGELDWDISVHKTQECQLVLQHAKENMHSRYPTFNGAYVEQDYDLLYNGKQVGYLTVGYYGPYALNDAELNLINSLNRGLLLLGIAVAGIAGLLVLLLSRYFTRPISDVVAATAKIASGKYGETVHTQPKTQELASLVNSVNEMSETLKFREEQKRRMTADIAHELRTPLSNLQSHAEAVIDDVWEPTPELFRSIHEEILRLTRIVSQLHELNELESEQLQLDKESIEVSELFESIYSDFCVRFQSKGVLLLHTLSDGPTTLWGDRDRIKQCMVNLVSNALRATPQGGHVTLACERTQGQICLSVADTGIGMEKKDLEQMFERFYRADPSRSKNTGGMGIGLAITKAIVEAHGGQISAYSALGVGTTVTMSFPNDMAFNL